MRRIIVLACLLLAACQSTPPLDRDKYLSMATRTYHDRSAEQVIRAAEQVIRATNSAQLKIADSPDGFTAVRHYMIYAVLAAEIGDDTWQFKAIPAADGAVVAQVYLARASSSSSATFVPTIGGDMAIGATMVPGGSGTPVSSPALYDLFWGRVDYLLGLKADWPSCADARAKTTQTPSMYGLCHLNGEIPAPKLAVAAAPAGAK